MTWEICELGEVATVGPQDPALPENSPFIPMSSVDVGMRYPSSYEERGTRGGIRARANDILFARITPCLENGKLAQIPEGSAPTGGSTEFLVIRPGPKVDPGYLYYWCSSPGVRARAEKEMTGTTGRMRFSGKDLKRFPIFIPSLDKQRRIVDILEEKISHLNAADAALEQSQKRLELMSISALTGALRGLGNTELKPIGTVAYTQLGKMLDSKRQSGAATKYLRNINVRWGSFNLDDLQKTPMTDSDRSRFDIDDGDVFACEGGEPGRCAVWRGPANDISFQKAVHRLRVKDPESLHPEFLALTLTEAVRSGRVDNLFTGTTIKHLPQQKLRAIEIPVPDIEEQNRIVEEFSEISASESRMKTIISQTQQRSAALRRSLLDAAFSGRLTEGSRQGSPTEAVVGV